MSASPKHGPRTGLTAPRIRASMRAWLRRRVAHRAGGKRANPLYRLAQAIGRASGANRFRLCTPERHPLTFFMSSVLNHLSTLGLGLAGGGGGSPGWQAKVGPHTALLAS